MIELNVSTKVAISIIGLAALLLVATNKFLSC